MDLSHPIHLAVPQWTGDPPVQFENAASIDTHGYFLRRFSMGEHSATHMNAPASFHHDGAAIDTYRPEDLVAPAIVIDVTNQVSQDPDYALTRAAVGEWESQHGPVLPGTVALLHSGWSRKWDTPDSYMGLDASGQSHFPGFGLDAARYLIEERSAAGLGVDTPGLEPGDSHGFPVNSLVLERPRLALENLTGLDQLPPSGATIIVGPLRLRGGSGSPVSALAFLP